MSKFWANLNVNDLISNLSLDNLQKADANSLNRRIEANITEAKTLNEDNSIGRNKNEKIETFGRNINENMETFSQSKYDGENEHNACIDNLIERNDTSDQLPEYSKRLQLMTEELSQLKEKRDEITVFYNDLLSTNTLYETKIQTLSEEIKHLEGQFELKDKKIATISYELENLRSKYPLNEGKDDHAIFEKEKSILESKLTETNVKLSHLTTSYQDLQTKFERKKTSLEMEIISSKLPLQEKIDSLEKTLSALRDTHNITCSRNKDLISELSKYNLLLEEQSSKNDRLYKEIHEKNDQIQKLTDSKNELAVCVEQCEARFRLHEDNHILFKKQSSSQLQIENKKRMDLQELLEELRNQNKAMKQEILEMSNKYVEQDSAKDVIDEYKKRAQTAMKNALTLSMDAQNEKQRLENSFNDIQNLLSIAIDDLTREKAYSETLKVEIDNLKLDLESKQDRIHETMLVQKLIGKGNDEVSINISHDESDIIIFKDQEEDTIHTSNKVTLDQNISEIEGETFNSSAASSELYYVSELKQQNASFRRELSHKDIEIQNMITLMNSLREENQILSKHVEELILFKDRKLRYQDTDSESVAVSKEYFKNCMFKFITCTDKSERIRLCPVIATLLDLSIQETSDITDAVKSSYFSVNFNPVIDAIGRGGDTSSWLSFASSLRGQRPS